MCIAILADVHANLAALEAVLRHAEAQAATDALWCLGDTVDYGPQPSECIARLRELSTVAVAGGALERWTDGDQLPSRTKTSGRALPGRRALPRTRA